jgi:hypothetical protein
MTTKTIMMKMKTMMVLIAIFLGFFVSPADAPQGADASSYERILWQFERLLDIMVKDAGNDESPLPVWRMTAMVMVFFSTIPARLAAAWGRLVVQARSGNLGTHWVMKGLVVFVVGVETVLAPFKLEDWEERARRAENDLAATQRRLNAARTAAQTAATAAQSRLDAARRETEAARSAADASRAAADAARAAADSVRAHAFVAEQKTADPEACS